MKKNKEFKQALAGAPPQRKSSFMTGVMLGTLVGGLGVYFTKTAQGKKTWEKLQVKWEKYKKKLEKEGTLKNAEESFEKWLAQMIEKFSESQEKTATSKKTAKKKRVRKKKTTFKGI